MPAGLQLERNGEPRFTVSLIQQAEGPLRPSPARSCWPQFFASALRRAISGAIALYQKSQTKLQVTTGFPSAPTETLQTVLHAFVP